MIDLSSPVKRREVGKNVDVKFVGNLVVSFGKNIDAHYQMLDELGWMLQDGRIRDARLEDCWIRVNVVFDEGQLIRRRVGSERDWTVLNVDSMLNITGRLVR